MAVSSKSRRNNYVLVVFDSCRYDSLMRARPCTIMKLGKVERRWSYASWTSPSHYNLLIGLMPHTSPRHVYASEYYKKDILQFNERLGYRTHAMVSLPVLNPKTILNTGFDSYKLMEKHNDMRAMVRQMKFSEKQPNF